MEDWREEMLEKIRLQGLQLAELEKTVNRLTKPRKNVARETHIKPVNEFSFDKK